MLSNLNLLFLVSQFLGLLIEFTALLIGLTYPMIYLFYPFSKTRSLENIILPFFNIFSKIPCKQSNSFCSKADYTLASESNLAIGPDSNILIDNSEIRYHDNKRTHAYGEGIFINNGNLEVSFKWNAPDNFPPSSQGVELGNYIVLNTDVDHQTYAYIYGCHDYCTNQNHAPDDLSSCYYEPSFFVLVREASNYIGGLSTEDRWDQIMVIFRQAGGSDLAIQVMTDSRNVYDLEKCGGFG